MGRRLFVGNLSYETTEDSLRTHFAADGRDVVGVRIMMDRETGRPRGFGFVDMASDEQAASAARDLDGSQLDGRALRVSEANERPPRTDRPERPGGPRPPRDAAPRERRGESEPARERPSRAPAPRGGGGGGWDDDAPRGGGGGDRGRERRGGKDRNRSGGEEQDWGGRRGGKRGRRPDFDEDIDDEW